MLPSLIERERKADPLILKIEVFDPKGQPIYGTNAQTWAKAVPANWLAAARRAGNANWSVIDDDNSAVGIAIKNNFGLIVGYLALNYSRTTIDRDAPCRRQGSGAGPALPIFVAASPWRHSC